MRNRALLPLFAFGSIACPLTADTWDGGGTNENFSTPANWLDDRVPAEPAERLTFNGLLRLAPFADRPWRVGTIEFAPGAGPFIVNGGQLIVTSAIDNSSGLVQTINNPIKLAASPLALRGDLRLAGPISGPGLLLKETTGSVELAGGAIDLGTSLSLTAGRVIISGPSLTNLAAVNVGGPGAALLDLRRDVTMVALDLRGDARVETSGPAWLDLRHQLASTPMAAGTPAFAGNIHFNSPTSAGPIRVLAHDGPGLVDLSISGLIRGRFVKDGPGTMLLNATGEGSSLSTVVVADGTLLLDRAEPYAPKYGQLVVGQAGGQGRPALLRFLKPMSSTETGFYLTIHPGGTADLGPFHFREPGLAMTGGLLEGDGSMRSGDINYTGRVEPAVIRVPLIGEPWINVSDGAADLDLTIAAPIDGTFLLGGPGVLALTAENPRLRSVIGSGTLAISSPAALGNAELRFDGTLRIDAPMSLSNLIRSPGAIQTNADITFRGPVRGSGIFRKTGDARLVIAGRQDHPNPITLSMERGTTELGTQGDLWDVRAWRLNVFRGASALVQADLNVADLTVAGDLTIAPDGQTNIAAYQLTVEPGGRLDITDNALSLRWTASSHAYELLKTVTETVARARNDGPAPWTARGLTSSHAAADPLTGIGVIVNHPDDSLDTIHDNFEGIRVDAATVLLKHTWNGDTDLDGLVNLDDYFRIDQALLAENTRGGWYNGDFNYDGETNVDDYAMIDAAFLAQFQLQATRAAPAVPAPVILTFPLLASLLLWRWRV